MKLLEELAELYSYGITISDILHCLEIDDVNIYGAGNIGKYFARDLFENPNVQFFDQNKSVNNLVVEKYIKGNRRKREFPVYRPDKLNKEKYIIVSPQNVYRNIEKDLQDIDINRNKLLSPELLVKYGEYILRSGVSENPLKEKNFLIVGGGSENKGAQSMVFTVTDRLKKVYPNSVIWVIESERKQINKQEYQNYKMSYLPDDRETYSFIYEIMPHLDGVFDVSGYAVTTSENVNAVDRCLFYWGLAYDYDIPLYILPQTFGLLNFNDRKKKELGLILSYANIIYAREEGSFERLTKEYTLKNLKQTCDLVLSGESIDQENIYINKKVLKTKNLKEHCVAIVPNKQNLKFIGETELVTDYVSIVDHLLSIGKKIFIINHAADSNLCRNIYRKYEKNSSVYLVDSKTDCLDFMYMIKGFDYVIASRYHGTIHSYRSEVPCIVLGWDDKYYELMKLLKQEKYWNDIRNNDCTLSLDCAIDMMEKNYKDEKIVIKKQMSKIREKDSLDEVITMVQRG